MTISKKIVGTGITQREVTHVKGTVVSAGPPEKRALVDPEDQRAVGEIIRTAGAATAAVLSDVRALCEEIVGDRRERWLAAAERMATAAERVVRMATAETIEECEKAKAEVDALRPPVDSEQWYAEKVLWYLDKAEGHRGMGRHEDAERWAFQAGLTIGIASMKFEWESITKTGAKVVLAAKSGHRKVYGTRKEKEARWARFQLTVKDVWREAGEISSKLMWEMAAQRLSDAGEKWCSAETLRKRCKDPRKG